MSTEERGGRPEAGGRGGAERALRRPRASITLPEAGATFGVWMHRSRERPRQWPPWRRPGLAMDAHGQARSGGRGTERELTWMLVVQLWRVQRWLASASSAALALLSLSIAALSIVINASARVSGQLFVFLTVAVVAALVFVLQTQFEYLRRTYDVTLAERVQDDWLKSKTERSIAATLLRDEGPRLADINHYRAKLDPIDDVLDILEDLGFYLQGSQISPEVAHHFFYHWIRGYWYAARPYIEAWQREEPARWNRFRSLFDKTSEFESFVEDVPREKLILNQAGIGSFLDEEIRYGSPPSHEAGSLRSG